MATREETPDGSSASRETPKCLRWTWASLTNQLPTRRTDSPSAGNEGFVIVLWRHFLSSARQITAEVVIVLGEKKKTNKQTNKKGQIISFASLLQEIELTDVPIMSGRTQEFWVVSFLASKRLLNHSRIFLHFALNQLANVSWDITAYCNCVNEWIIDRIQFNKSLNNFLYKITLYCILCFVYGYGFVL